MKTFGYILGTIATLFIIEGGELSVETDQGWGVWYPLQEPSLFDGY